jgi:ketosteroid isomerase-like protein
MSQENVERLRRFYASLNEGSDEPLMDFLHPAFVYRTREELPGGGTYRRHDFPRRLAELRQTFREGRFEVEGFIASPQDVVVVVRVTGLGRISGVPVDERMFHTWTIHNGKALALRIYSDRGEALEAAGLSEQDAHADS